jgi:putative two-component system response regulator
MDDSRDLALLPDGKPLDWIYPAAEEVAVGTSEETVQPKRILIVDDEHDVCFLLGCYLSRLGFECEEAASGMEAVEHLQKASFDAVLTDIHMPRMTGIELLKYIKDRDSDLAVIMITANDTTTDAVNAMKIGADDYILKPFVFDEISLGLSRALERRQLRRQVRAYQTRLEQMVIKRTSQLQRLFINVIQSLIFALEAKDRYTNGHSRRVSWLALKLGGRANLSNRDLEHLQIAAMFHDLGKIGISESILLKPVPLTIEEYSHIQTHPDIGVKILQPMKEFQDILPIVRHHHEHYDGSGYPSGLKGEEIPIGARIIAVADAFDALTTARPYRSARSLGAAFEEIMLGAGRMFDPELVKLFEPVADDPELPKILLSPEWWANSPSPGSWAAASALYPQSIPDLELRLD